jgi:hypothetical protein
MDAAVCKLYWIACTASSILMLTKTAMRSGFFFHPSDGSWSLGWKKKPP